MLTKWAEHFLEKDKRHDLQAGLAPANSTGALCHFGNN